MFAFFNDGTLVPFAVTVDLLTIHTQSHMHFSTFIVVQIKNTCTLFYLGEVKYILWYSRLLIKKKIYIYFGTHNAMGGSRIYLVDFLAVGTTVVSLLCVLLVGVFLHYLFLFIFLISVTNPNR